MGLRIGELSAEGRGSQLLRVCSCREGRFVVAKRGEGSQFLLRDERLIFAYLKDRSRSEIKHF